MSVHAGIYSRGAQGGWSTNRSIDDNTDQVDDSSVNIIKKSIELYDSLVGFKGKKLCIKMSSVMGS